MTQPFGSPVVVCGAAQEQGLCEPVTEPQCTIGIVSIKERNNEQSLEYKGGANEIFVKGLDDDLVIEYQVTVCTMSVTLWIEFDPGNQVHAGFYQNFEGNGVTSPRVVVIVGGESREPGTHQAIWDGRDRTADHRILLDGTYKVRIQGLHDHVPEDLTTISIMPPPSENFGIDYKGNTTRREAEYAAARQTALLDGTAFVSASACATTGLQAWQSIRVAAVGTISGHSNPARLALYPEESTEGQTVAFDVAKKSVIGSAPRPLPDPAHPLDIANSTFLPEEPGNALRDVFLVVLAGCKAGNEVMLVQRALEKLANDINPKGIDGDHGPLTTAALKAWQEWEGISPADGTKNPATLERLGIDPSLDEIRQTRRVQTRLTEFSRRYHPGPMDGIWGPKTEAAITHYQQDHSPPLDVNSLPDQPTRAHLRTSGTMDGQVRNIAEALTVFGANLSFGFVKSVSFTGSEKWHMLLWDKLVAGSGVDDAAAEARALCGATYADELEYHLYARAGVDPNSTLHPARYGRDMV